jgi:hypothetical protein
MIHWIRATAREAYPRARTAPSTMFLPGWTGLPATRRPAGQRRGPAGGSRPGVPAPGARDRRSAQDRLPADDQNGRKGPVGRTGTDGTGWNNSLTVPPRPRGIIRTPARQYLLIGPDVYLGKTRPPFASATEPMDLRGLAPIVAPPHDTRIVGRAISAATLEINHIAWGLFINHIFGFLFSKTLAVGTTESYPQFHRQR